MVENRRLVGALIAAAVAGVLIYLALRPVPPPPPPPPPEEGAVEVVTLEIEVG
jgi:hypothetical protein